MENELEKNIGIIFTNKQILKRALTHNSYSNEQKLLYNKNIDNFEKLEFLGDAILEFVITEYLYNKYPNASEGTLTKYRSIIVKGSHLSFVAKKINLGKYLYLSKGEYKNNGQEKTTILENAMEALIGAIYLDQGMEKVKKFISTYILSDIGLNINLQFIDAKTKLQELIQDKYNITPKYKIINEKGPDHNKHYTSVVIVDNKAIGIGSGNNKKNSELMSAQDALNRYKKFNGDITKINIKY